MWVVPCTRIFPLVHMHRLGSVYRGVPHPASRCDSGVAIARA